MLNYLEQTTSSSSSKRTSSDIEVESPAPKRSKVSLARFDDLQNENRRLKGLIEKYKQEWMRTYFFLNTCRNYKVFSAFLTDNYIVFVIKGKSGKNPFWRIVPIAFDFSYLGKTYYDYLNDNNKLLFA